MAKPYHVTGGAAGAHFAGHAACAGFSADAGAGAGVASGAGAGAGAGSTAWVAGGAGATAAVESAAETIPARTRTDNMDKTIRIQPPFKIVDEKCIMLKLVIPQS